MPQWVASPEVSSARAGVGRAAARGTASGRVGTLLLASGVLTICLAAPATLVSAQEAGPPADAAAGQGLEQAPAPLPSDTPPPPPADPPGPSATPPMPPGTPDDSTPPPDDATAPGAGPSTLVSSAGSTSVSILDGNSQSSFRFSPSSVTVGAGDTVTWTNNGSASEGHDVSGSGGLGSGTLHSGQSYSHTFASPGTFSYICSIHPFMKGTVTVQGTSSGGGEGGGGGGGNPGATPPTGTSPTSPGSESAAVTSADAAGSATQLPSTGMPLLPLLAGGFGLLLAGAVLRRRTLVSQR
jgi:plastocyanin